MTTTAPAAETTIGAAPPQPSPHNRRVCFSFAAYAKAVIDHLRSCRVPVAAGLSDDEFAAVEAAHGFVFPPDLRSILREGLPVGTGYPNWRSSSPQQLRILLALPVSGLLHEVSRSGFWHPAWRAPAEASADRVAAARAAMETAPALVPIYRHFYIPAIPYPAGNPVFYIRGSEFRCAGFDLADFFQREELCSPAAALPLAPAWAAKSARKVEMWSDLAEGEAWVEERARAGEMEVWMKEMGWRLREGGWGEEEVKEMLVGGSDGGEEPLGDRMVLRDRQSVLWHVRLLALTLLRAGWSNEDVADCCGCGGRRSAETWQVGPGSNENEISMEF